MFVAIEGIEGSGKSTLLSGLADWLRAKDRDVLVTFEPGGTPVGRIIRDIFLNRSIAIAPLTEAMLVNAARAQHVADEIRPALQAGRIVLCDRFTDSTLAYQGYGRGLEVDVLRTLCDTATAGLAPDLVFVVDIPIEVALSRMRMRSDAPPDRIESEGPAFHERVRQGFLELARSPRHRVLDGVLAPEPLLEQAARELREHISARVP
jgi:dTMP kinase